MTYEEILKGMLSKVPSIFDKRKGSIVYIFLAPVAWIISKVYELINKVYDMTFADTSTGEYLSERTKERGVKRKEATKAVRKGIFNMEVPIGSRFAIDKTTYTVIEVNGNEAKLECEQTGEIGNDYIGDMLPITYISGLTTAQLTDILIPGEDEEDDESLRERYFGSLESQAFGGNQADYRERVKNLNGVGGLKIYPAWNGGGTVKLVIIDSSFNKPSSELIDSVQTAVDPIQNSGEGLGLAAIGHHVTVEGVESVDVNVESNISLMEGYSWENVLPYCNEAVEIYLKGLAEEWENSQSLVVRIAYIESALLSVEGVLDIQNTTINGQNTNLILTDIQIPALGTISRSEAA